MAAGKLQYIIVAIDYFTKWVEAEALTNMKGTTVISFCWRNILCRFGVPRTFITDNGPQFANDPFKQWCIDHHVQQKLTSVYHPQANGQVEVTNRTIINGIKARLMGAKGNWIHELPSVLWSYRTAESSATGETPYSLVYGVEAVIPAEVGVPTIRTAPLSTPEETQQEGNEENLRMDLDLIEEKRTNASLHEAKVKERMKVYHNRRVRKTQFSPGDLVMRMNEKSKAKPEGKLAPNWEGPYRVREAHPGGSYLLETMAGELIPRRWNIVNLRVFHKK
jgi:hypothetical protein